MEKKTAYRPLIILPAVILFALIVIVYMPVNAQGNIPPINPTPTPTGLPPEPQQLSADMLLRTTAAGRGIDQASFSATFFDNADLQDPLFTRPYADPLAFELLCFGQSYPYEGCKLIPDLTEGGSWSVRWTGILVVPETGEYTFYLEGHDDGERVLIGGEEIVDSGWRYPSPDNRPPPQTVTLEAGYVELVVEYEQRVQFAAILNIQWSGPGFSREVIPLTNAGVAKVNTVEFTQAIQELQSLQELKDDLADDGEPPIPMIALKRGVVRVYFEDVPTAIDVNVRVRVLGQSSQTKQISLVPGCSPEQQRLRANGCTSADFYFVAPEGSWNVTVSTTNLQDESIESHEFSLTSRTVSSMKQVPVSVYHLSLLQPEEHESGDKLADYIWFLRSLAPTHYVQIIGPTRTLRILEGPIPALWWPDLILQMNSLWVFDGFPDRYYHGIVPEGAPGSMSGMAVGRAAGTRRYLSPGLLRFIEETVAHESGHLLGRKHTNSAEPAANGRCTLPDWPRDSEWEGDNRIKEVGFSVPDRQVYPPDSVMDVMSYCSPQRWVSPYTYLGLMEELESSAASRSQQIAWASFWQITGRLDQTGDLEKLAPIFAFEGEGPMGSGAGDYRIDVLDANGTILFTRNFEPVSSTEFTDVEAAEVTVFSELIPQQPGAEHIRIVDPEGNTLRTINLVGFPPIVLLSGLPEDQPLTGEHELEWEIIDTDSDEHTVRVEYLPDGVTRHVLSWDTLEHSLVIDFDKLPGCSESCLIRVLASDGVNTGISEIRDFSVMSKPPAVKVVFPTDGEIYKSLDMVWLQAVAQDPDDGYLNGDNITWASNLDGQLGNGDDFSTMDLTEGTHHITVRATDSDGNTASDDLTVRVDGTDPQLALEVDLGDLPVTCPLITLNASDGPGGSGLNSVEYSLDRGHNWIAVGFHQLPFQFIPPGDGPVHIVARATDHAGNLAAADLRFYVDKECGQANLPPTASADGPYTGVEGTIVYFDGSNSFDPEGDSLEYRWDFQSDGTFDTPFSSEPGAAYTYPDDFLGSVTLQVRDSMGLVGTDLASVEIENVPPILTGADVNISEGQEAEIRVEIEDPGIEDTHTATIQWPDEMLMDPQPVPIEGDHGSGVINVSRVFSDNGSFQVTFRVQDDDGAESRLDVTVYSSNVAPQVILDRGEVFNLPIGEVFIGRAGVSQSHQAMAVDPGSDDLTFLWEYVDGSQQMPYYNNGVSPDPKISLGGIFPFSASDTATIEYTLPGFYEVTLEVQDDDGGVSAVDFSKLITGNEFCTRSQGFWKHQFSGKGKPYFTEDILQRYLDLVSEASGYFGEVIPLDGIELADRVMNPKGPDKLKKAEAQLLAAWLNFINGALDWDEIVQFQDGTTLSVGEVLPQVEIVLSDPHSTDADFAEALEIAEFLNLRDEGNSSCD